MTNQGEERQPLTILAPLDGSERSQESLAYIRMLSSRLSLKVRLLRCYEAPAAVYALPERHFSYDTPNAHELGQILLQEMEEKKALLEGISCEATVSRVDPTAGILDQAEEADMVVMSSHGRSAFGCWLVGSVTTKIARACTRPVLVVARPGDQDPPRLKTIMVCLDGSQGAEAGLRQALILADAFEARLIAYRYVPLAYPYPGEHSQPYVKAAESYLEKIAAEHPQRIQRTIVRLTDGPSMIVDTARQEGADLVVLGRRGQSAFSRWIMGSVGEEVIHQARCAVLVVH